jgi:hypothetical protein
LIGSITGLATSFGKVIHVIDVPKPDKSGEPRRVLDSNFKKSKLDDPTNQAMTLPPQVAPFFVVKTGADVKYRLVIEMPNYQSSQSFTADFARFFLCGLGRVVGVKEIQFPPYVLRLDAVEGIGLSNRIHTSILTVTPSQKKLSGKLSFVKHLKKAPAFR